MTRNFIRVHNRHSSGVIFPQVKLLTNFKVKLEFSGSKVEIGAK